MGREKNLGIELLRILSVMYIVGFWHMVSYTASSYPLGESVFFDRLTNILLGSFVFISGYFLGARDVQFTVRDIRSFYTKRFIRLYPLYLVALLVFQFVGLNKTITTTKAVFLSAIMVQPAPLTLWFVTMLLLFTLLAPFFIVLLRNWNSKVFWLFVALLLGGLYLYNSVTQRIDVRMMLYLPVFLYGMAVSVNGFSKNWKKWATGFFLLGVLVTSLTSLVGSLSRNNEFILQIPLILGAAPILFHIFSGIPISSPRLISWVTTLGYTCYCTYLFHRIIYQGLLTVYSPVYVWQQVIYVVVVGLPMTVLLSYGIQRSYDWLVRSVGR
ncbi:acyltransferase [bacterium]|nr:acyltransferase [bacterium]